MSSRDRETAFRKRSFGVCRVSGRVRQSRMGNFAKGRAHFRQNPQREKTERKRKSGENKIRCRAIPQKQQSTEKEHSEKSEELPGLNPQGESRRIRAQSETVGRRFRSETHRSAGRPESSSRQDPQDEDGSDWEKSEVVGTTLPGRIRKRKVEVDGGFRAETLRSAGAALRATAGARFEHGRSYRGKMGDVAKAFGRL